MLSKFQRPDEEIKEQHLNDLEDSFSKCPFCNSELVERTRKSDGGKFFGCKGYPKCRYTTQELKTLEKAKK
jgi:DNA topoisomerase-1